MCSVARGVKLSALGGKNRLCVPLRKNLAPFAVKHLEVDKLIDLFVRKLNRIFFD